MLSKYVLLLSSLAALAAAAPYPFDIVDAPSLSRSLTKLIQLSNPVKRGSTAKRDPNAVVTNEADAVFIINDDDGIGAGSNNYKLYKGDGSEGAGWPTRGTWVSFSDMFEANKASMFRSCEEQYGVPNTSEEEVQAIKDSIQAVAAQSGVDHRFVLAVIMQESSGCVRVPTSQTDMPNPGLMQSVNGQSCNDGAGKVSTPCPNDVIHGMIVDGAVGTTDGDGLASCIDQSGLSTDADFYRAARLYNSGEIGDSGKLEDGIATHCYASDIANRLTGWLADGESTGSPCTCDDGGC